MQILLAVECSFLDLVVISRRDLSNCLIAASYADFAITTRLAESFKTCLIKTTSIDLELSNRLDSIRQLDKTVRQ